VLLQAQRPRFEVGEIYGINVSVLVEITQNRGPGLDPCENQKRCAEREDRRFHFVSPTDDPPFHAQSARCLSQPKGRIVLNGVAAKRYDYGFAGMELSLLDAERLLVLRSALRHPLDGLGVEAPGRCRFDEEVARR
jgi:hypothetical protein